jgi:hypothetical protein
MRRCLFFIPITFGIIVGLSIQFAFGQTPLVKTAVDKRQILIGEQLKYQVEAQFPSNAYQLTWLNVPDSFSHFEIVTRGKIDTIENNGLLICRQTFTLTSFDSGIFAIPALPITFEPLAGDKPINLFTDSIPINVTFSPLDSTKTFHDIKTIIEVKDEIPLPLKAEWYSPVNICVVSLRLIISSSFTFFCISAMLNIEKLSVDSCRLSAGEFILNQIFRNKI